MLHICVFGLHYALIGYNVSTTPTSHCNRSIEMRFNSLQGFPRYSQSSTTVLRQMLLCVGNIGREGSTIASNVIANPP